MTFPQTPRPILVELKVASTDWANVSNYVYQRDNPKPIELTFGRPDAASVTQPCEATFQLNNRSGVFSPRNPSSILYGLIGRNTPVRIGIGRGRYGMVLKGSDGRASTPDSAGLSITGDIDIRVDLETSGTGWLTGSFDVASKFRNVDGSRAWTLRVIAGQLQFNWFSLGTAASVKTALSTVVVPFANVARGAVRVTLDVDNGAAGNTVTFYSASTIAGPWTIVGAAVVQAGVTSIFNDDSNVRVGANPDVSTWSQGLNADCTVYSAEVYSGIAGTLRANPVFSTQPLDRAPFAASAFADVQLNTWSFSGAADAARIWYGNVDTRFTGEISELPPEWDVSGQDAWVSVAAAGLLRRLGQGSTPAETGLRNFIYPSTGLFRYWPLSGAAGTTYSLDIAPVWGEPTGFRYYSESTATTHNYSYGGDLGAFVGTGMAFYTSVDPYSSMRGDVGLGYANWAADFVFSTVESTAGMGLFSTVWSSYDGASWQLQFSGGVATVLFDDGTTGLVPFTPTGVLPELQDLLVHHVRFKVLQNGANSDWTLYIDGNVVDSGTQAGYVSAGLSVFRHYMNRTGGQERINLAHLAIWGDPATETWPSAALTSQAARGYAGEAAGTRISRIATLAGYSLTATGDLAASQAMGPQYSESLMTQLRDAESADMGILTEPRDSFGLLYRTHKSLFNQTPVLELDVSTGQVAPPFKLVDDDQNTRNDITAVRREGDSYRLTQTTGTLNVSEPPVGVGRYHDESTVNVETDSDLPTVASWLLHLGTFDEARMPSLNVNLANPDVVAGGTAMDLAVCGTDVGDLVRLNNIASLFLPDDLTLIVHGGKEWLGPFQHEFAFNCGPGSPYDVIQLNQATSKWASGEDSTLSAALTTSATSMLVLNDTVMTRWTTAAGEMPISVMVAGEEITVTAISGGPPSFVGVGTSATANNASVTPGLPAGAASGDMVLIAASVRATTATVTTPANWTVLATGGNFAVLGRIYDGVWTMPAVAFAGGAAGDDTIGQSAAFRNVTFTGSTGSQWGGASAQNISLAGAAADTSTLKHSLVIVAGWKQDDWTTVDPLYGLTELGEQVATVGNDAGQVWDYLIKTGTTWATDAEFVVTGGAAATGKVLLVGLKAAPQTFTVTRSVNGVVKTHVAGEVVRLKRRAVWAL